MKKLNLLIVALLFLGIGAGKAQYAVLLDFDSANGEHPYGSLTFYANKLYGMTKDGGANGSGCIFRIDTDGSGYNDLYDFNDTTGANPWGDLTISGNKMYGMTSGGMYTFGNIFSIDTNGSGYKDLYDFGDTNGFPEGDLTLSGNKLYGMTPGAWYGYGNIFSIDTNGKEYKNLFQFNFTDGAQPNGSLTLSGGVLYGAAEDGGPYRFDGDIFSIDTNGSGFTVMHYFNDTDGAGPEGKLVISGNKLFGMTGSGDTGGCIFSINTNGSGYKTLHDFDSINYGCRPTGSLTLSGGVLYGMASYGGGSQHAGCIFGIDTNGNRYRELFYFNVADGGGEPDEIGTHFGSLIPHGGNLYGMTLYGGTDNIGVVFAVDSNSYASVNNLKVASGAIDVYPNPNNGVFIIQSSVVSGQWSVEIYNVMGEKVEGEKIKGGSEKINLSSQPSGVYFFRVLNEGGGLIGEGKVVIQN